MAFLENAANKRRNNLVLEVLNGEKEKDVLPNSAYSFEEERQAQYFSHARNNMKSDMAYATMNHMQQLDDIRVLKELDNERL